LTRITPERARIERNRVLIGAGAFFAALAIAVIVQALR